MNVKLLRTGYFIGFLAAAIPALSQQSPPDSAKANRSPRWSIKRQPWSRARGNRLSPNLGRMAVSGEAGTRIYSSVI